jgi:hypothetical protein
MTNIVCVTSKLSLGCSFFDWSINFLSGKDNFLKLNPTPHLAPLCLDPVNSVNSHGHEKNHPAGITEVKSNLEYFLSQPDNLYTMYPRMLSLDVVCQQLKIDYIHLANPEYYKKIHNYQEQDYHAMLDYCANQSVKLIYVHNNYQARGYFWNIRTLERQILKPEPYENINHAVSDFQEIFFTDSITRWGQLGLSNQWDIRERMALDLRPFDPLSFKDVGIKQEHLWVDCQDLWHDTASVLDTAMDYISVAIDQKRWQSWLLIANKWQTLQKNNLKFHYTLDHIVNSIVHNWYYPLPELTLTQEAIIQHCLIYKHNLNLKSWQLDRFPSNTQDLYKLLEPNIHQIDLIY